MQRGGRRWVSVLAVGVLAAAVAPALAVDYWPTEPGAIYVYRTPGGAELIVRYGILADGTKTRLSQYTGGCGREEWYVESSEGDLLLWYFSGYCPPAIDPSTQILEPPVLYLDLPLSSGNSWFWQTPEGFMVLGVVGGEESVTVPAGTFDIIRVGLIVGDPFFGRAGNWVNRELGRVKIDDYELLSVQGVIPNDATTFGGVKALYR